MAEESEKDEDVSRPSIYLSYLNEAENAVAPIRDRLTVIGFKVYPTPPPPGSAWTRWVRGQVNDADVVVVLLTGNYFSGDGVLLELAEALDSEKKIIPVLLESGAAIPAVLRGYQSVVLSGRADSDDYLNPLLEALSVNEPPVDRVSEIGQIEAQERLLRRETEEQARSIEEVHRQDRDKLADASLTSTAFASGTMIGMALGGPISAVVGGIVAAGISAAIAAAKKRRSKSESSVDSPSPTGAPHDA
ncbi:toll/interleukin-1 receptor domain-containing protein [Streptomyces sp. NPDC001480]|uniref:toll/interleukin-1 receptor domain-containing protein n=1 Tax=Streptomyces sp. NPDC001480 TaxID=3364577 RepID=UPI00368DCE77